MKKVIMLALATLFMLSCQEAPKYIINGTITDKQEGMVYLKSFRNKMFFDTDSVQIIDGKFKFEGTVDQPLLYAIATDEMRSPQQFFIENVTMNISMTGRGKDFVVTNSPANDLFFKVGQDMNQKDFDITALVSANPESNVAAFYLYRYFTYQLSLDELKATRAKISSTLNSSPYVTDMDQIIKTLENVQTGKTAPDFTLPDVNGNPVSLSSFRGQYVLVDFWAAWCPPCRRENPNIVKTYNEYKDKNFTIIGISLDHTKAAWLKGIEDDDLTWTHVSDLKYWDSEVAALYGVRAIPANYLLDPDGKIIGKNLREEKLPETLKEILK